MKNKWIKRVLSAALSVMVIGSMAACGTKETETTEETTEEMTVELELEDGSKVNCAIVTILEVQKKDYIVLLPLNEDGKNSDGEVWFYRYLEDKTDVNAEPELAYIDSDEEYERVADAFDEYLDSAEFDELVDEEEKNI